jgi:hypothetical protein
MQAKPTDPCGLHFFFGSHYRSLREFGLAWYSMLDLGMSPHFSPKGASGTSVGVPLNIDPDFGIRRNTEIRE